MPAKSQSQEKFMNFVHAVQKGEASGKGYSKVEEAAKEMKPSSVEHFMGRGHIDKDLPKTAFEHGFLKRAAEYGIPADKAQELLKHAGIMGAIGQALIKHPIATAGGLGAAGTVGTAAYNLNNYLRMQAQHPKPQWNYILPPHGDHVSGLPGN